MNTPSKIVMLVLGVLTLRAFQISSAAPEDNAPRTLAPYFTPATAVAKPPDADGFLQRWLLLEPIRKPNRGNTVFTDSYVRNALTAEYFSDQLTAIPRDGDKVTVAEQELV